MGECPMTAQLDDEMQMDDAIVCIACFAVARGTNGRRRWTFRGESTDARRARGRFFLFPDDFLVGDRP
jgi:hypothetical protein